MGDRFGPTLMQLRHRVETTLGNFTSHGTGLTHLPPGSEVCNASASMYTPSYSSTPQESETYVNNVLGGIRSKAEKAIK
ncbi:MAG: hypothetical protein AAGC72_17540 [Planctomycetota bacterium]